MSTGRSGVWDPADASVAEGGATPRVISTEPRGGLEAVRSCVPISSTVRAQPVSDRHKPRKIGASHHPAGVMQMCAVVGLLWDGCAGSRSVGSGAPPPEREEIREAKTTAPRGMSPQTV